MDEVCGLCMEYEELEGLPNIGRCDRKMCSVRQDAQASSCNWYTEVMPPKEAQELIPSTDTVLDAFDYASINPDDASFLREKTTKISNIRMMTTLTIGKELAEVHDRLASYSKGKFGAWCESIGISRDTGNNYIRMYNYVAENFGSLEEAEHIQPSLLMAASKPSAPAELSQGVISGDITTHKEYKELDALLKRTHERLLNAKKSQWEYADKANSAIQNEADARKDAELAKKQLKDTEAQLERLSARLEAKNLEVEQAKQQPSANHAVERQQLQQQIDQLEKEKQELEREQRVLVQQINSQPLVAATKEVLPADIQDQMTVLQVARMEVLYEKIKLSLHALNQVTEDDIALVADYYAQKMASGTKNNFRNAAKCSKGLVDKLIVAIGIEGV